MRKITFAIVLYIDEEDIKEYFGLDEDEVTNFTDSDYYLTALDCIERGDCEYIHVSTEKL